VPILALGGEAATGNNTAIAVISLVSIVFTYLMLAALWHFVFRERRARGRSDSSEGGRAQREPVQREPVQREPVQREPATAQTAHASAGAQRGARIHSPRWPRRRR
jgi:hypothetical protein